MVNNTYKYRATHYTGANVSIMIGPHLLTQCFGIEWQLSQTKRPIYGYHSQYFDGISNGVVLVTGQLFLNYVHTAYLSTVLQKYYQFQNIIRESVRQNNSNDLIDYLSAHDAVSPLVNVIRDALDPPLGLRNQGSIDLSYAQVGELNSLTPFDTVDSRTRPNLNEEQLPNRMNLNMSNSDRTRALDQALNAVFEDERVQEDLISFFTGGVNSAGTFIHGEDGSVAYESSVFNGDRLNSIVERNQHRNNLDGPLMSQARPDQFGDATSSPHGIDIIVHFGPPYGNVEQNQIYNYSNRSSFVLKDVVFNGESGQITNNDEPILETYTFMARKKEPITRDREESNG